MEVAELKFVHSGFLLKTFYEIWDCAPLVKN